MRNVARAASLARSSALTLLILGGLSAVFCAWHPLTPGFIISVAVVLNGVAEWRLARRLAARDPRAARWLSANQVALGLEILAYALWQAFAVSDAEVASLLRRPPLQMVYANLLPEMQQLLVARLPAAFRLTYGLVGTVGLLGCLGMAWYYHRRGRSVTALAGSP